jgi:hypothetical protein
MAVTLALFPSLGTCPSCIVLLNKAFDRVWHPGLIFKLRKYGICGIVLKWIESFLYDRKQRVNIDGCFSRWKTVNSGYPKGPHWSFFIPHQDAYGILSFQAWSH